MRTSVFLAVIGAALLHAMWNALVKGGADKRMRLGAVIMGHTPYAIVMLIFVAPPPAPESLPYLFAGIVPHMVYQLLLLWAYETGDLTQVYPIARGSAPMIVALVSVVFLGVHLSSIEGLAVLVIGVGIVSLGLVRRDDGQRNRKAAALALATGACIASYSLIDGLGARAAGTALGFYCWLTIGNGIVMMLYLAATTPSVLGKIAREGRHIYFLGGCGSFAAYAIVTWAFTQAPIALVTALREISIIFALLIGVFVLKERLNLAKVASTMATLLGVALLRINRQ